MHGFSAPKLHTSTLAAILYTFVTQNKTHPINELAIVTALSWQPLAQIGKKVSLLGMGTMQG